MKENYFISLEGIEGVGKTTNLRYLAEYLHQLEKPIMVTREPGGTALADDIRRFILSEHNEKVFPDTELMLIFAARAQHIAHAIKPALANGKWVLCDRFTDASYAYQGAGRGIASERIAALETWVQGDLRPDLTILLDAPISIALERIKSRGKLDRFESEHIDFFHKVRDCYLQRAQDEPKRFRIVDASRDQEQVQSDIRKIIDEMIQDQNLD
jgi:dTMP kinase